MLRSFIVLFCLTLCGCQTVEKKPAGMPFHALYQPIEEAEARDFLQEGIKNFIKKRIDMN